MSRHEIEYRRPLGFRHEPVEIHLWVSRVGGAGFDVAYIVTDPEGVGDGPGGTIYAVAETELALYDFRTAMPRRMRPDERASVLEHVGERGALPPSAAVTRAPSPVTEIDLGDPRAVSDLATFVGRAKRADPEGAVRLQLAGPTLLVTTVAVIEGSGLLGEGPCSGCARSPSRGERRPRRDGGLRLGHDRLARAGGDETRLSVPPTTVSPAWAALTPPREGWERVGGLDAVEVKAIAERGIAEVAQGTPEGAGAAAVSALRRRVWGAMSDTVPPIAAGLAFGAHVLGFAREGETVAVSTCGRWARLSTSRGHVLVR